jgi:hypothetical protein
VRAWMRHSRERGNPSLLKFGSFRKGIEKGTPILYSIE